jgi:hypothetical protein
MSQEVQQPDIGHQTMSCLLLGEYILQNQEIVRQISDENLMITVY